MAVVADRDVEEGSVRRRELMAEGRKGRGRLSSDEKATKGEIPGLQEYRGGKREDP